MGPAICCGFERGGGGGGGGGAALDQLGLLPTTARAVLAEIAEPETRGGGRPVGRFRSLVELVRE
jgi:hypothetical protein